MRWTNLVEQKPIERPEETSCRMEEAWLYLRLSFFPKDLTGCVDVHANPRPSKIQTDSSNLVNLQPQRPNNEDSPHLPSFAARRVYSRQELFALPSQKYHDQEFRTCLGRLKANGLLRYRGARRSRGEKPEASQRPIPCRITCSELGKQPRTSSIAISEFDKPARAVDYSVLRKVKHQKSYDIPVILSTKVRALTNKVDEIQEIAEFNSISAICITETWLSPSVPDSCVASMVTIYFARIELLREEECVFI